MRRLIQQLIENMTYRNLSGRRRPRRYVIAAGLLFLAMIPAACRSAHEQSQVMTAVYATPAPPATPWPTQTPTPPPAPTPTPVVDEAGCPADPKEWTLESIVIAPGAKPLDLFRIRPDCVYQGLARSVAAIMLTEAGWKIPEVVEALRLPRFPVRYHQVITVTFEYTLQMRGEPLALDRHWLPSSAYLCTPNTDPGECPRIWRIDGKDPRPLPRFLRGCFWPRHLAAGQVRDWGMPYPVICVVEAKEYSGRRAWLFEGTGDRMYQRPPDELWPLPRDEFYAYDPQLQTWLLLGQYGYAPLNPAPGMEQLREITRTQWQSQAERYARYHGLPVWDGSWLEAFTGLKPKPLPEGWESWPDRYEELLVKYGAKRRFSEWSP
jgi:hypothetical protein